LRERAEEYAALIMEELAPDGLYSQYIEVVPSLLTPNLVKCPNRKHV